MNLQEACDFWETTKYNYCLICDKLNLNDMERRRLLYINWSLIIDFDTGTGENGLLKPISMSIMYNLILLIY